MMGGGPILSADFLSMCQHSVKIQHGGQILYIQQYITLRRPGYTYFPRSIHNTQSEILQSLQIKQTVSKQTKA